MYSSQLASQWRSCTGTTATTVRWRFRRRRLRPQPASSAQPAAAESIPQGTVQIVSVIGAGNLQAEAVVIRYTGAGELDLTGWHLKDNGGQTFTFPPFKLFKDGAVQVHSGGGTNTAIDLFWGQRQAAWQSGQSVLLTTPEGDVQDSYPVP